jgi:glycosyltransferase involved in cell wall biosynthesis
MIAVARLRADGFPLVLDIIGQGDARTTGSIHKLARELDPAKAYLKLVGPLAQGDVYVRYREADVVVFASTCEALPNIVIEAMLCGSTIACSDSRPMPDILEEAGQYFDATDPETIGHAIRTLLEKPELRVRLANKAAKKAQSYSWEKCADDTFAVFREVVLGKKM